jgi:hypothetical protein
MELIEYHCRDAFERHVIKQSSQQNASGLNEERSLPTNEAVKPNLIPDLLTKSSAPQASNLPGN